MSKLLNTFACASIALILSACGQKGNDFVGTWQSTKFPSRSAQIERNGDGFLLKVTEPSFFKASEVETKVLPAVYKDGTLQVQGGFGTASVGYVKATDTLLMPTAGGSSLEYHRTKK
jgi:hypothetical protein